MKVLVVNNMAPFVWGGAEELAKHLKKNLIAAGHEAEVMRIPFQWEPAARIPSQMLMVRAFETLNVDRIIALKFPAYLIPHPEKTIWLLHQYRQAYDLYDAALTNLSDDEEGQDIRNIVRNADNETFGEARRIFTISDVTRRRLFHHNGFVSTVLAPPPNDPELFTGGEGQGYIFAGGRVNNMKRQFLLVEALAFASRDVRLVIAGPADAPADAELLKRRAEELGVADRVKFDLRFLRREELARYVNNATACAYLPFDEDAISYVAMEAATAGKAILSSFDSGGVLGLVRNNDTGLVVDPVPKALAQAMSTLCENPALTRRMGLAANELLKSMDISWPRTVERLLQ
jgi:glycosyltransferase involved in cell wall biosynthesis